MSFQARDNCEYHFWSDSEQVKSFRAAAVWNQSFILDFYWPMTSLNIFCINQNEWWLQSRCEQSLWGKKDAVPGFFWDGEKLFLKLTTIEEVLQEVLIAVLTPVLINSLCGAYLICCGVFLWGLRAGRNYSFLMVVVNLKTGKCISYCLCTIQAIIAEFPNHLVTIFIVFSKLYDTFLSYILAWQILQWLITWDNS